MLLRSGAPDPREGRLDHPAVPRQLQRRGAAEVRAQICISVQVREVCLTKTFLPAHYVAH